MWMFIQSYEKLRQYLFTQATIDTLIQFEYSAFEEATVPICTFVFKNSYVDKRGCYLRLTEFRGGMEVQRQKALEAINNHECGFYYEQNAKQYSKIPGSPVAYWVSEAFIRAYNSKKIGNYGIARSGLQTGNNDLFLKYWHEVSIETIAFGMNSKEEYLESRKKWIPQIKGGEFRKWYGNFDYVVNWKNDGRDIKECKSCRLNAMTTDQFYFKKGITWSHTTSSVFGARYLPTGYFFNVEAPTLFLENDILYFLGFLDSCVAQLYLNANNSTMHYLVGNISALPIIMKDNTNIHDIVEVNIHLSKIDWDSFETSWDFQRHPLLRKVFSISEAFEQWHTECDERFNQLKINEEDLNRIFIDIYGLQDELTPEVEDKDITVRKADLSRDIRSFVSYAVGCMFGRYSLDEEGLIYAGGEWDGSRYKSFIPDEDNCIPITDEEYFSDDIVRHFVEFIKTAYGADTLEENLDFIANALGNKGDTSREVIRNYFLKDFYADHLKVYQKRPIYWLFDSGKQNGFKALIYMHRYDADTVGRVRTDYLHRAQKYVETAMQSAQYTIDNASSTSEKSKATKAVTKYTKQLAEMKIYDEAIAHIANKRIEIDLDDGVKVNYEKFQGVEVAQEGKKALKVDLLAKIK